MTASPSLPGSTLSLPSQELPRMSHNSSLFSPLDFVFTPSSVTDNSSSLNRTRSIITLAHSACPASIPDSSFLLQNSNAPYLVSEILVALLAIIGNSLTILVFVKNRKLRRLTNYYIVSLAAADLLVGVLGIPFAILTSLGMPEAREPCLLMLCTLILLCTISIFSLVGVSVDRYWAILHPLIYARLMTASRARRIILLCWVLGTVIGLLPLFGWHLECQFCLFTAVMDPSYLVFLYLTTIVCPGILMAFFYGHIFSVVIKQLRQIVQQEAPTDPLPPPAIAQEGSIYCSSGDVGGYAARRPTEPSSRDSPSTTMLHTNRREVKAAKNLSIIVLFFMICWFPLYTINCINAFCSTCDVPLQLLNFTIILSHANSAINPLLYAYHMKDFRYALKALLYGRIFGTKLLKHRPSTTIYRSHQSDRYLHRSRHGNGRDLNTAYRRSDPNRLTPTYDTPTNVTPLSVSPYSATPTEHKLNPFCDSFQKALVQTLEKHSEIDESAPDMSLVVDTLKIASLPPSQLHLTRETSPSTQPNCPLIQVSTIPTPTDDEETCDDDRNDNDRNDHVVSENVTICETSNQSNGSPNVELIPREKDYLSGEGECSFPCEKLPASFLGSESLKNAEDFLVDQIVSDPPYRDQPPPDRHGDATQVQTLDHQNNAS